MTYRRALSSVFVLALTLPCAADHTKNVLITGYWPPTNEMVRPFSANPLLNPGGWIGANWENRGYDIYSYFPEFSDPDCNSCGQGMGDFEVDYQDTSADFWPIVEALQPVLIITCSRTGANFSWELERNAYNNDSWVNDYTAPLQPTPSPPDDSVSADFLRTSTLPMQAVVDVINASSLGLNGFICESQSAGSFLSGFMAYHGMWYQSIHAAEDDPARCVAAGHIHVGDSIDWDDAHEATKITLRTVLGYADSVLGGPGDVNVDGAVDVNDLLDLLAAWGPCPPQPSGCPADQDDDGQVTVTDLLLLLANWS